MKQSPNRDDCLKRDNYTCQICGKNHCRLDTHHKDFIGYSTKSNNIDDKLENLITLCRQCHKRIHFQVCYEILHLHKLREQGLTFAAIGRLFNLSRQRIHKILQDY